MDVRVRTVAELDAVPEKAAAIILYLTETLNGVALVLDLRQYDGAKVKTRRLLERNPRSKKNAIRLAEDLAAITCTQNVYIINCHDDSEPGS